MFFSVISVDKLTILTCLLNQILTFSAIRDVIDERVEKIKQGKIELRSLHGNDRRRELDAIQKYVLFFQLKAVQYKIMLLILK